MSEPLHAFDYLAASEKHAPSGVCVLFGDEPFLKRLVKKRLVAAVLEGEDVPFRTFDGSKDSVRASGAETVWRDVVDELSTVSLFSSGPRLVVVDDADEFVSLLRTQLEDYLARPAKNGVLLLVVNSWPSNTRLYKAVDASGLAVDCRAPQVKRGKKATIDEGAIQKWLCEWAKTEHHVKLAAAAAKQMLNLVGPELGILDNELAKLALLVEAGDSVSPELVVDVVGGWRTKDAFAIVDAAADGNAAEAIEALDRLLGLGEAPQALFGAIAWSLRRYAMATRIFQRAERDGRRVSLEAALKEAGFPHWNRSEFDDAQRRLKQIGRHRASRLYRWLLEADLAMKGSHSHGDRARLVLERLIVRLSQPAAKIPVAKLDA